MSPPCRSTSIVTLKRRSTVRSIWSQCQRCWISFIAAVNAHQRTDKGFGPALGPGAAQAAVERLERIGYAVTRGVSEWVLAPQDRDMQIEMLSGWAAAAQEIGDISVLEIADRLKRRREHVSAHAAPPAPGAG